MRQEINIRIKYLEDCIAQTNQDLVDGNIDEVSGNISITSLTSAIVELNWVLSLMGEEPKYCSYSGICSEKHNVSFCTLEDFKCESQLTTCPKQI